MPDILAGLNEAQRQVVLTTEGPVLVMAGAGSGKTRALTHRIAYVLQQRLASPEEILAVTFTNKAAAEMKNRVAALLSQTFAVPRALSTFHSLGAKILREQAETAGRSRHFTIVDEGDSQRIVKQAADRVGISRMARSVGSLRAAISRAKGSGEVPSEEDTRNVFEEYQRLLAVHDACDFDDLLGLPVQLLSQSDELRTLYQARWRYVSVDEYQDTNDLQVRFLDLLLPATRNICVVGDDYQAIYSWRGANVDHIRRFPERFPGCATLYLKQNYRSTPEVLTAANAVMAGQGERNLWTQRPAGAEVTVRAFQSDRSEAAGIRRAIQSHVAGGGSLSDCAVLYRTNAQSRLLEEEFLRSELPYTIVGGFRFYERREIKDALALLALSVNPNAKLAVERVAQALWRGVGPKTIARWHAEARESQVNFLEVIQKHSAGKMFVQKAITACQAAAQQPFTTVAERLHYLLLHSGYLATLTTDPERDERQANLDELLNVAGVYSDVTEFLETVALLTDLDRGNTADTEERGRITCMTLHAAKGLEFPVVFIVGCEEGLLPHINSLESAASLEEERRLLYVGMTRAKDSLQISYARQRLIHGSLTLSLPSRFLEALPAAQTEGWGEGVDPVPAETEELIDYSVVSRG